MFLRTKNNIKKNVLIFLTIITTAQSISTRQERKFTFPIFPTNTAAGILVALALPIDIPGRNVYLSYNFEANHGTPTLATDYTNGLLQKILYNSKKLDDSPTIVEDEVESKKKRSLNEFTRKRFYTMLEEKMDMHSLNGKSCLLKTICEVSRSHLYQHNALVGHIMHVLFTPSSSSSEDLPPDIIEAERLGMEDNCQQYNTTSLLDYISVLI